jgi:hypothetical protein
MTENTDKSLEMMRFNDEQRDADMQVRIPERTPVKTDPGVMLTVLVGRLLLEHGVELPAAALAFHVQEDARRRSGCRRPGGRAPRLTARTERPAHPRHGWAGRPAASFEQCNIWVRVCEGVARPALTRGARARQRADIAGTALVRTIRVRRGANTEEGAEG